MAEGSEVTLRSPRSVLWELVALSLISSMAGWEPAGIWILCCHFMERETEAQKRGRDNHG